MTVCVGKSDSDSESEGERETGEYEEGVGSFRQEVCGGNGSHSKNILARKITKIPPIYLNPLNSLFSIILNIYLL